MSSQVLGDVQLCTKQEIEVMIEAVNVPESEIDHKIETSAAALKQTITNAKAELRSETELVAAGLAQEAQNRASADTTLDNKIRDEAQLREDTDDALRSRIEREEGVRETADHELSELIVAETAARKEADNGLHDEFKALLKGKKSEHFEDTIFCVRLENIPLAQATVELHDATLEIGDILATVSADYLPEIPVTFNFVAELRNVSSSELEYFYIGVRLDATGNAVIINKTKLEGEYIGNVNSTTFMYITKE